MINLDKESRKKIEKFSEFVGSEKLEKEVNRLVKEKIRNDLTSSAINNRTFTNLAEIRSMKVYGWYEELVTAIINASRTVNIEDVATNLPDPFGGEDIKDVQTTIGIKSVFSQQVTIDRAEFSNKISFHSDNQDILDLLEIRQNGGEWVVETEGEEGSEKNTYVLNAKRGYETTTRVENMIKDALMKYFAENKNDLQDKLEEKFEKWMKGEKIEIEKDK